MNDYLSDFVTRINNAASLPHSNGVEMPLTKLNESAAKLLAKLGYVTNVRVFKDSGVPYKSLHLEPTARFSGIRRVSKPGRRVYKGYTDLRPVLSGIGVAILSTPKGLLTDRAARKNKIGGEVLFEIW